jgi:hypothetical protein
MACSFPIGTGARSCAEYRFATRRTYALHAPALFHATLFADAMADPATEMLIHVAGNAISEVLKSVLHGLGKAKDWFRATTTEHDPFGVVARRYAERMQERYGSIRIFGMPRPIPLGDTYVRVNFLPKITSRHRSSVEDLQQFFDRDKKRFGSPVATVDGLELLNEPRMDKVFVLGKPGAGKTTFLKWLALQALARKLPDKRIPLFISLKDWNDSKLDLLGFAVAEFDSCGFPDADAFVERLLETGGFLILFDGLDEITGDVNKATMDVRRFTEKYPDNKFVISCRIAAYSYVFEQFVDVEMADFTSEHVERFVDQWFHSSPAKARSFHEKLAEPQNGSIRELASTPLLLTMLCLAFDELMDFPRNRSDLYGEAIDALLKKWDASRNIRREDVYKYLSARHKQDLLSVVASRTFPEGKYFVPQRELERTIAEYIVNLPTVNAAAIDVDSEAVLKSIEAQHGLLVERAQRIYSFSHLTFQEYFMARFLVTAGNDAIEKAVSAHMLDTSFLLVLDTRWREVFLLLAEMLSSADELLIAMRSQLTPVAAEAKLIPVFREMESSGMLLQQNHVPPHIQRILGLAMIDNPYTWHGLRDVVHDVAVEILSSFGYTCEFGSNSSWLSDIDSAEIIDDGEACSVAMNSALEVDGDQADRYIRGTRLLVDCLRSEAYVTASLRKSLLEGLCIEF